MWKPSSASLIIKAPNPTNPHRLCQGSRLPSAHSTAGHLNFVLCWSHQDGSRSSRLATNVGTMRLMAGHGLAVLDSRLIRPLLYPFFTPTHTHTHGKGGGGVRGEGKISRTNTHTSRPSIYPGLSISPRDYTTLQFEICFLHTPLQKTGASSWGKNVLFYFRSHGK